MLAIKKKGNRYYKEDRFSLRSFPIKKTEAEKLITEDKAELVDFLSGMSRNIKNTRKVRSSLVNKNKI